MADKAQLVTTEDFTGAKLKLKDIGDGYHAIVMAVEGADDGGPGASGPDKELVLSQYRVKTAFTGAAVGDTVSAIRVLDLTTSPAQQSGPTLWYNETTQAALAAAPAAANLEPLATGGLTNAQFTAGVSGLATSAKQTTMETVMTAIRDRMVAALGSLVSANSTSVTIASDDVQIGTKVTAVPALATGGKGIIGWLSALWQAQINTSNQLPSTIGTKTSALSLSVAPSSDANVAREVYSAVVGLTGATPASGTGWGVLSSQACTSLDLINATSVDVEYRRNGAGVGIPVPAFSSRLIQGITNANQIGVRRVDQGVTPVNVFAEAFTV